MEIQDITLIVGAAIAIFGFFRSMEQKKEQRFLEIIRELSNKDSSMLRSIGAAETPKYFYYRSYMFFERPFKSQSLSMALHALKIDNEEVFVRQECINSVQEMFKDVGIHTCPRANMIRSKLNKLIMHHFDFRSVDLSASCLNESDLGSADLRKAKLWECTFRNTNLKGTKLDCAEIWDADFSDADLEDASLRIKQKGVNAQTCFQNTTFRNTKVSEAVVNMCGLQGVPGIIIVPTPSEEECKLLFS